jgi:phage terminase small subunit
MSRAKKPPTALRPLTPRQDRFVAEYLVDLNATQAAIRAGFSAKNADVTGPRLLGNVGIAEAIAKGKEERNRRTGITADRVLEELALLAFSDVTHYAEGDNGAVELARDAPGGATRALQSVKRKKVTDKDGNVTEEIEFRMWDKPGPLKLAGRHVGLFPDKIEVTGKNGAPIDVRTVMTTEEARQELAAIASAAAAAASRTEPDGLKPADDE